MDINYLLLILLTLFFWGEFFILRRKKNAHTKEVFNIALAITAFLVVFGGAALLF
ncbi:hypothetical protein [Schleiferilactobacillus harbinensis]|uniref:hypothetical protein n=1 Tax=Schleiferilactobacillus harbinensis TaxID=304207 RepID=UPI0039ED8159